MQPSCDHQPPPALFPAHSCVSSDASSPHLPSSITLLSLLPVREEDAALGSPPSAALTDLTDGKLVPSLALEIPSQSEDDLSGMQASGGGRSVPVPISMTRSQTMPASGRNGVTDQQPQLLSPNSYLASPPPRHARIRDSDSRSPSVTFSSDSTMPPAMAAFHSSPSVFPQDHTAHSSRRGSIAGDGTFTSNSLWNSPDRTVPNSPLPFDSSDVHKSVAASLCNELRNPVHGLLALVELLDNSPALGDMPEERELLRSIKISAAHINDIVTRDADAAQIKDNLLSAHLSNGASSLCGGGSASVSICNSTVSSPIHSSRVSQQLALAFTSHPSPLHSEGRLVQPPRVAGSVATPPVAVVPNQSPVPGVGSLVGSDWCPTVNATSSTPLLHAMTPSSASSASAPFALTPASAASSYLSSPPPSTTSAQHSPVLHSGRPPTAARPPLAVTAAPALTALPARPLLPAAPMSDPSPARDLRVSRTPPPLPAGSLLSRGISSGSSHKFDLSGLSVLIVDDMSLNRKVLRKMLDGVRDVDVACDGVQAVEMVRRRMEAALKITMPPMDMEAIAREHAAGDGAHAAHPEPNYDASSAATIAGTPGSVTGGDTPLSPPQFPLQHTHAVDATVSALLSPTSNGDGSQATGRSLLAHPLHLGPSLPFVLPAAQETHSGLGRHNSFPSMPSQPPPSASLRAGPSPSLHSSARTPDPIGLLSPVSPGTPLVMPRTPLLDSSSAVSFMQQQQHLSAVAANPPSPHSNGSIGRRHTLPSSMLRPLYPHSTNSHPLASAVSAASLIRDLEWQYGLPPVPIIAVTSNTLLTDRIACAKRDINWFLSKPFSRKDIVSVLELIVHERSLQANSLAPLKRAMHMQMMHATGDSTVAAPPSSCVESCSTESALVRRASACSTAVSADLLVPAHSADSAALAASDSTLFLSMLLPAPALTMGHSAQREISMRDNPQTQQTQQRLAPAIPSPSSVASVPLALASPWLVPSSSLGCSGGSSSSNSSSLISVVSCVSPSPSSPPLTASAPAPQLMCHPSPAALLDDADSSSDSPLLPPVAAAHQAQQRSARPGDSDRLTAIGSSAFTCLSHRHSSSSPAGGCSSDE